MQRPPLTIPGPASALAAPSDLRVRPPWGLLLVAASSRWQPLGMPGSLATFPPLRGNVHTESNSHRCLRTSHEQTLPPVPRVHSHRYRHLRISRPLLLLHALPAQPASTQVSLMELSPPVPAPALQPTHLLTGPRCPGTALPPRHRAPLSPGTPLPAHRSLLVQAFAHILRCQAEVAALAPSPTLNVSTDRTACLCGYSMLTALPSCPSKTHQP